METQNNINNPPYYADDEIDLFELWETIWQQKTLIMLVTFVVTAIAVVVAFALPRVYETEARILPPQPSGIDAIRPAELSSLSLRMPTREDVYKQYLENLLSTSVIKTFLEDPVRAAYYFDELKLTESEVHELIDENYDVILPVESRDKPIFTSMEARLKYRANDPENSVADLRSLLKIASDLTIQQIRQDILSDIHEKQRAVRDQFNLENDRVNREINAEISRLMEKDEAEIISLKQEFDLENERINREIQAEIDRHVENDQLERNTINEEITLLREEARNKRQFRIERLRADYNIAKSLGIDSPISPSEYNRRQGTVTTLDISGRELSRYWLGTKILLQEIQELESRDNDDPFISELSELFKMLEALKVNQKVEILKNRKNNFPFSEKLRSLKAKLDKLDEENPSITILKSREDNIPFSDKLRELQNQLAKIDVVRNKIETADFSVYRTSREPVTPLKPIKPNKKLIVLAALILGMMLGVFTALIRSAMQKRRQSLS